MQPVTSLAGPAPMDHRAVRSIIVGLMLAILLGALDQTIVSVSLPRMAEDLHGFSLLAWVVSAYLVASTVVTPVYGKLGDLFGRRVLLLIAIGIFLAASTLCAVAQTMPELIAARVIQGIGGGGLISISQAIIADVVPLRERGRYQGYISGVFALSNVAGPVVGGLLTHYLSWRWIFWINLPLGLAAFLVSRRALSALPIPGLRRPIDYIGASLLTAGLTALLIGITRVGQGEPWLATEPLLLFVGAVIALALFIGWEARVVEPIVPLFLFRMPAVSLSFAILFLGFFELIGMSVLLPLRFQMVAGLRADEAAWRLIPLSLMIPLGAFFAGRLMLKTGRYKPIQVTGAVIVPLGLVAIAYLAPDAVTLGSLAMGLTGIGIGLQFPTSLVAVQNAVPAENVGIATACTAFFRSLGGAFGVAVLSAVLLSMLASAALPQMAGQQGADVLHQMLGSAMGHADPVEQNHIRILAEHAFRQIFLLSAIIATLPVLFTIAMPDRALRGSRDTSAPHEA